MSNTPRTDAECAAITAGNLPVGATSWELLTLHARTLERELAQAVDSANKAESQWPRLKKYQPCGCIVCTCIGEQCAGCGARSCGTHDPSDIPDAVYEDHPVTRQLTQALKERDEARDSVAELIAAQVSDAVEHSREVDRLITDLASARACIRDAISRLPVGAKGIRQWVGGDDDIARWERHGLGEGAL